MPRQRFLWGAGPLAARGCERWAGGRQPRRRHALRVGSVAVVAVDLPAGAAHFGPTPHPLPVRFGPGAGRCRTPTHPASRTSLLAVRRSAGSGPIRARGSGGGGGGDGGRGAPTGTQSEARWHCSRAAALTPTQTRRGLRWSLSISLAATARLGPTAKRATEGAVLEAGRGRAGGRLLPRPECRRRGWRWPTGACTRRTGEACGVVRRSVDTHPSEALCVGPRQSPGPNTTRGSNEVRLPMAPTGGGGSAPRRHGQGAGAERSTREGTRSTALVGLRIAGVDRRQSSVGRCP